MEQYINSIVLSEWPRAGLLPPTIQPAMWSGVLVSSQVFMVQVKGILGALYYKASGPLHSAPIDESYSPHSASPRLHQLMPSSILFLIYLLLFTGFHLYSFPFWTTFLQFPPLHSYIHSFDLSQTPLFIIRLLYPPSFNLFISGTSLPFFLYFVYYVTAILRVLFPSHPHFSPDSSAHNISLHLSPPTLLFFLSYLIHLQSSPGIFPIQFTRR